MKIYVAHSSSFDYMQELYAPLRNSELNAQHMIFLPHETDARMNTKEAIEKSDLVIAEVSYPSTGEGIELGWADGFHKPILCVHKAGMEPSNSLKVISNTILAYSDAADLISKIEDYLSHA